MNMATSVPWGDSTYGNTPQQGQVLWEEYPCVVRSPNSMLRGGSVVDLKVLLKHHKRTA